MWYVHLLVFHLEVRTFVQNAHTQYYITYIQFVGWGTSKYINTCDRFQMTSNVLPSCISDSDEDHKEGILLNITFIVSANGVEISVQPLKVLCLQFPK